MKWRSPVSAVRDIRWGLYNVWRWLPIIWRDADFDHCYLLTVMEFKFRNMRKRHETARVVADWKRAAKQLMICENLCKRLKEDDYGEGFIGGYNRQTSEHVLNYMPKQDERYLGMMIAKHLRRWWD